MSNVQNNVLSQMSKQAEASLKRGDILFRWVPPGINQRHLTQVLITVAQWDQAETQHVTQQGESSIEFSAALVQHVGIYTDNKVIEIGKKGLERNPVEARDNYDLVVRSRLYGDRIAALATIAVPDKRQVLYPIWDLLNLSQKPTKSYGAAQAVMNELINSDRVNRNAGKANVLKQAVVCSHFVHAVLYAAATSGTLRTATDHRWDAIFKISPSHMWTEFVTKRGLWSQLEAGYMGLQHKGKLYSTTGTLGVGLPMRQAA